MENLNPRTDKVISSLTYGSLMVLAIGLLTSMSLLALSHILIIVPALYLISKVDYRKIQKSTWALLTICIVLILSVAVNQDIATNGFKPALKVKYFIFGILTIFPVSYYFTHNFNIKKIGTLLYTFCISTTVASLIGMSGMINGYNYILRKHVYIERNAGVFGMLMNYSHNMVYFQIIILGMVIYRKSIKNYINLNFLYIVFVINLAGLYLTYTRGAWIGFLAAIPFFFLKKNLKVFLTIIATLIAISCGIFFYAGNSIIRPKSDVERISQWQAAVKAFEERPFFGYGYLNFETHSKEIKERYNIGQTNFIGHAHNNFFEMLASTGIIGFTAYLMWLGLWFTEMYKRNDVIGKIGIPFIVAFIAGGLTQSTISLGINLFFVMAVYSITQVKIDEYFKPAR